LDLFLGRISAPIRELVSWEDQMSEVVTTRASRGTGVRIALTLVGAAAMIVGAFLHWTGSLSATNVSVHGLLNDKIRHSGHFFTDLGLIVIVLGLLALLGVAFSTGWLTRLAGALGIVVVAVFWVQIARAPGALQPGPGAWLTLAGSILVVVAGFLGASVVTSAPTSAASRDDAE
jgi:hypothetical protein